MQISDHLHILKIPFQVFLSPEVRIDRFVNVLLVYGKSDVVLIDSGVAGTDATVLPYLLKTGRQVKDLKKLLLSLAWLQKIKDTVISSAREKLATDDPLALCRQTCAKLGLPLVAVNFLVARSFVSCLSG
jgi:hypothetical protein